MFFEYLKTSQYQDSIDIEDIGNCFLRALNDEADCWVMAVKTVLGESAVVQAGPFNIDFDDVGGSCYVSMFSFEYSEKRLHKSINDFINNPKRTITSVEQISEEEYSSVLKKLLHSLECVV